MGKKKSTHDFLHRAGDGPRHDELTPRVIVEQLDQYIVGQTAAKRAVAIALRNRYRRSLLAEAWKDEVTPKNILMIGSTGVGKTEIARRLAHLVKAPFLKVEATKFTEVGYVGRDVESMIRDLVEIAVRMVRVKKLEATRAEASQLAEERLITLLVPGKQKIEAPNPFAFFLNSPPGKEEEGEREQEAAEIKELRQRKLKDLRAGKLEDEVVEIEVEDPSSLLSMPDWITGSSEPMGTQMYEMLQHFLPKKTKKLRLSVREAHEVLIQQEGQKLIDHEQMIQEALQQTEQFGMIFLDELDKVAGQSGRNGPDVSREGVQRDILPIVEGSTVMTKYGPVKTDHILFIAAGAFHVAKPSDLIPELQGRFPIRVELSDLSAQDFVQILTEPQNALTKQYAALLATEGVTLTFTEESISELASLAEQVNRNTENIGARRLSTLLEKLLEELSFEAPTIGAGDVKITADYVRERLHELVKDQAMSHYVL